jgi:hypothetical protein
MLGAPFVMLHYGQRLRNSEVEIAHPAVDAEGDLHTAIANEITAVAEFQLTGNPEYAESSAMYRSDISAALDSLTSSATRLGEPSSAMLDRLKHSVGEWLHSIDQLQLTERRYPRKEIPGLLVRQDQFVRKVAEAESSLHQAIHTQMNARRDKVRRLGRLTMQTILVLSLLGAVLIILIARLVRRLQQETGARAQILRVVSHDLRNPLTTIQLSSSTLLQNPDIAAHQRKKFLEMIRSSSDRMNALIADLSIKAGPLWACLWLSIKLNRKCAPSSRRSAKAHP